MRIFIGFACYSIVFSNKTRLQKVVESMVMPLMQMKHGYVLQRGNYQRGTRTAVSYRHYRFGWMDVFKPGRNRTRKQCKVLLPVSSFINSSIFSAPHSFGISLFSNLHCKHFSKKKSYMHDIFLKLNKLLDFLSYFHEYVLQILCKFL